MQSSQLFVYGAGDPDSFGPTLVIAGAVLLVAAWVVVAGSRFVRGGIVERPERVPQLYGYTMCLVGLLWALVSLVGVVESAQTLAAPAYRRGPDFGIEPSVTSFEAFRLTYDRARRFSAPDPNAAQLDTLPEAELRRRYETYRADRIAATRAEAGQSVVTRGVSLLLGAGLFAFHWRWLRRWAVAPAA